jgi:glyoxylase-like metal-dependent hydrolase (beta-lactamase superfamily II)
MEVKSFIGGFDKNFSYLVWCPDTRLCAVIDPAIEVTPIFETIEKYDLILNKIFITHTHHDHIVFLEDYYKLNSTFKVVGFKKLEKDGFDNFIGVGDMDCISLGNQILICIHTPGHFPDSMCYWVKHDSIIFTGDTLFVGRPGRTIGRKSSIKDLYNSLYNKIFKLHSDTKIYPGHHYGYTETISIKDNIVTSDFFKCTNLEEFIKVMKEFEKNRLIS